MRTIADFHANLERIRIESLTVHRMCNVYGLYVTLLLFRVKF